MNDGGVVFATYCEDEAALLGACLLTESLRTFGGRFRGATVRTYSPAESAAPSREAIRRASASGIDRRTITVPETVRDLFYSGKPFAAGRAEIESLGGTDILVWMDDDTVILNEPSDLLLPPEIALGYVPVMHNRAGLRWEEPPDEFWSRVYELLEIDDAMLFPMETPADRVQIRCYFHCGLAAVRPEAGIMRNWSEAFMRLADDSNTRSMCRDNRVRNVFLHQHALTGAILHAVGRERMRQLPNGYNYPLFFDRQYEAARSFDSIADVVTIRRVVSLDRIGPSWHEQITGPADRIAWLRDRWK